jgi:molecular chaperone DnaK (HSP70)
MMDEAEQFKEQDDALRKVIDAKNSLENTLYSAKNGLDDEMGKHLDDTVKEELRTRINDDINWIENITTTSTTTDEYELRTKEFTDFLQTKMNSLGGDPSNVSKNNDTHEDDDFEPVIADID